MKKNIVLVAILISVGFFSCERTNKNNMPNESTEDTLVIGQKEGSDEGSANDVNAESGGDNMNTNIWKDVDLDVPSIRFPEISSPDLTLRGNDRYTVYSLGENILFDSDKATLRPQAEDKLKQISASLKQRYENGQIRIYGYTDAEDSKTYNKELSEQRAQAVKQWLTKNGVEESRISIHPMGESKPIRSNATEAGKEQNRRVEIVAMNIDASSQGNNSGASGNQNK